MSLRRVSWADAALIQPFQRALSSRRGVWATLLCSPAACQTDTGVNVGRLSLLFLMMLEHNGGSVLPKTFSLLETGARNPRQVFI